MSAASWPIVVIESPFTGNVEQNLAYLKRACIDCLRRQQVPYASHLFFTQFLDDMKPEEREMGLTAGYAFWSAAKMVAFYSDLGMSKGMERAKMRCEEIGKPYIIRLIGKEEPK